MWLIDVITLNPYLILLISILYFPLGTLYLRQLNMLCNVWRTIKLQRHWDVLFYKLYISQTTMRDSPCTHVHTTSTRTLRAAHAHASDKCVIYVNDIYRIKRQCLISLFRLAMYIGGTLIKIYLLTYLLIDKRCGVSGVGWGAGGRWGIPTGKKANKRNKKNKNNNNKTPDIDSLGLMNNS